MIKPTSRPSRPPGTITNDAVRLKPARPTSPGPQSSSSSAEKPQSGNSKGVRK